MIRAIAVGLGLFLLALLGAGTGPGPAAAQTPSAAAPVSAAEVETLARQLEDPQQRARLIEQLRLLARAQQPSAPPPRTDPAGLIERFLGGISGGIATIGDELASAAVALKDVPRVMSWLERQIREPELLEEWTELLIKLGIVLAAGLAAVWLCERGIGGIRGKLDTARAGIRGADARASALRAGGLLLRALLGLAPLLAFLAAAYVALALVQPDQTTRLVTLAVINANMLARAILAVARLVLVPRDTGHPALRLSEESAAYAFLWVRRLVTMAVYGFFLLEAALLVGLPVSAYNVALRVVGLVFATELVLVVLQNRAAVADALRRIRRRSDAPVLAIVRRVADIWHVLVIVYVAAIYLVWALGVPGGFTYLTRATGLTVLVLALVGGATALLRRVIARGFAVGSDLKQRLPGLEARANRYLPLLNTVLRAAIYLVAGVALLQAWGIDSFRWLGSDIGRRMLSSALSIALVIGLAVIGWEVLASMIERYLSETDAAGNPLPRSARTRTLLPLFRNAVMILIIVLVALIVMSEIGIDIAPLLAGAGVVGLAIGFGAQTLVKDVITGLFILIEDTINVGDVVTVDQRTGVVESISVRSIRIRDSDGAVHTVPFSAVSTVKNLTRGFSFYVFDVAVGAAADIDAVTALLRRVDEGVRGDARFTAEIIEPLDIQGVDKLIDGGVQIRARIKTLPGKQWSVGREYNRRIADALAAAGVPAPVPQRAVQVVGGEPVPRLEAARAALADG